MLLAVVTNLIMHTKNKQDSNGNVKTQFKYLSDIKHINRVVITKIYLHITLHNALNVDTKK